MYTLRSIAKRGSIFGAAAALLAATMAPGAVTLANSLNPLTERSLLLSSSAPGWQDTDGSGFSEDNLNPSGNYYAAPGTGPNGKKTGQTFSFRVSTDSVAEARPIESFSLQYCTTAAGLCQAPGNNTGDARDESRQDNEGPTGGHANQTSDLDATALVGGVAGVDFTVTMDGDDVSDDWTVAVTNKEDVDFAAFGENDGSLTGKGNYVTLTHSAGGISPEFNDRIEIKFNASSDHYITNPGSDAFFVKMNTYDASSEIIDGGVTVANVMTDSIHITTKVLETMAFSVGIENPDTQNVQHGSCDALSTSDGVTTNNRLNLGNPNAESSLETDQAHDVYSYWRLSSNSSGGATVYYSGDTLKSTVNDAITPMTSLAYSQPGTEQFGLSLMDAAGSQDPLDTLHPGGFPDNHITPNIAPLVPVGDYNAGGYDGSGALLPISNANSSENGQFKFNANSRTVPEVIAQNNDGVLSCATAKVRYVANIAADTPAGVYTTKINYLAAPQY